MFLWEVIVFPDFRVLTRKDKKQVNYRNWRFCSGYSICLALSFVVPHKKNEGDGEREREGNSKDIAHLFKSSFQILFRVPRCTVISCFYSYSFPAHCILTKFLITSGLEGTIVGVRPVLPVQKCIVLCCENFYEVKIANFSDVQGAEWILCYHLCSWAWESYYLKFWILLMDLYFT